MSLPVYSYNVLWGNFVSWSCRKVERETLAFCHYIICQFLNKLICYHEHFECWTLFFPGWYLPYISEHGLNAVTGDREMLRNSKVSNLKHWQAAVVSLVREQAREMLKKSPQTKHSVLSKYSKEINNWQLPKSWIEHKIENQSSITCRLQASA